MQMKAFSVMDPHSADSSVVCIAYCAVSFLFLLSVNVWLSDLRHRRSTIKLVFFTIKINFSHYGGRTLLGVILKMPYTGSLVCFQLGLFWPLLHLNGVINACHNIYFLLYIRYIAPKFIVIIDIIVILGLF